MTDSSRLLCGFIFELVLLFGFLGALLWAILQPDSPD